jgi:hypothetical protein
MIKRIFPSLVLSFVLFSSSVITGLIGSSALASGILVKKTKQQIYCITDVYRNKASFVKIGGDGDWAKFSREIPNFIIPKNGKQQCKNIGGSVEIYDTDKKKFITNIDIGGNVLPSGDGKGDTYNFFTKTLFPKLTNYLLGIALAVSIGVIVWGGILMITSFGAEEDQTKGKNSIVFGLVGLFISSMAIVIVKFVLNINFFF